MIQHDEEWYAARAGKVTGSRICDVTEKTATGAYKAARRNYLMELLAEQLGGMPAERFHSSEMRWGAENERAAVAAYEWRQDIDIQPVGFINHPTLNGGCSPDGFVGDDGVVEIKCPNSVTHIEAVWTGTVLAKYRAQCLWHLACTGRAWVDFVSFDPRMPPAMQLFITRIERDQDAIDKLEDEVLLFLGELGSMMAHVRLRFGLDREEERPAQEEKSADIVIPISEKPPARPARQRSAQSERVLEVIERVRKEQGLDE